MFGFRVVVFFCILRRWLCLLGRFLRCRGVRALVEVVSMGFRVWLFCLFIFSRSMFLFLVIVGYRFFVVGFGEVFFNSYGVRVVYVVWFFLSFFV